MRVIFEEELRDVADTLDDLALHVDEAIKLAGAALLKSDVKAAESVIEGDRRIDALETSLAEACVALLAKQQPVATDLRVIVSTLQLSSTLERMGDLLRHIAEIGRGRYPEKAVHPRFESDFERLQELSERATGRIRELLSSRDLDLAQSIIDDDDETDAVHQRTYKELLDPSWDGTVQQTIDVTLLGRFYERFGDHAVSVARRSIFITTGDIAQHDVPNPTWSTSYWATTD